ncbi:MAG: hypothetical protein LC723_06425 [Actinobacteria bacterium]|nr:hypothetical protein [Actinomycetota bacterium]
MNGTQGRYYEPHTCACGKELTARSVRWELFLGGYLYRACSYDCLAVLTGHDDDVEYSNA